ncbi:hypothetical protein [Okeania sp. SIO1F9]|nr:hypothetical protein [Okeania sp. SIO1F9]
MFKTPTVSSEQESERCQKYSQESTMYGGAHRNLPGDWPFG